MAEHKIECFDTIAVLAPNLRSGHRQAMFLNTFRAFARFGSSECSSIRACQTRRLTNEADRLSIA